MVHVKIKHIAKQSFRSFSWLESLCFGTYASDGIPNFKLLFCSKNHIEEKP